MEEQRSIQARDELKEQMKVLVARARVNDCPQTSQETRQVQSDADGINLKRRLSHEKDSLRK